MSDIIKLYVYGNKNTGVDEFLQGLDKDNFLDYLSKFGYGFVNHKASIDGLPVSFHLWTHCRDFNLKQIYKVAMVESQGALIVVDVNNIRSYESIEKWITKLFTYSGNGEIPIVIFGNVEGNRSKNSVHESFGKDLIKIIASRIDKQFPSIYLEGSLEDSDQITSIFSFLGREILSELKM